MSTSTKVAFAFAVALSPSLATSPAHAADKPLAASASSSAAAAPATASEKAACLDASEAGQALRKSGKLRDAHAQLLICADPKCPAVVRGDCAQWATEVDAAAPSLAFVTKDSDGKKITDVTATVDGTDAPIDAPFPVDPGSHLVHFTRAGSASPIDVNVTVASADKKHEVDAVFPAAAVAAVATVSPTASNAHHSSLVGPIVFGAIGVVGLGVGAALVLSASSKVSSLRSTCAPNCSSSDVDSARDRAFLGDALLGVGGASLVAAGYMFFTRATGSGDSAPASSTASTSASRAKASPLVFDVVPSTQGARAIVHGEF